MSEVLVEIKDLVINFAASRICVGGHYILYQDGCS